MEWQNKEIKSSPSWSEDEEGFNRSMTNFDKGITFASEDEDGDLRVGMSMMSNKLDDNLMDFAEF